MYIRKPDQSGLWTKGCTKVEKARNCVGYLAKYAGKGLGQCDDQMREYRFPRGCRIQGAGGLAAPGRIEARWWLSPRWAREASQGSFGDSVRDIRKVSGGWVDAETGVFHESPWVFVGYTAGGRSALFALREKQ
jgi:hypothetical protein